MRKTLKIIFYIVLIIIILAVTSAVTVYVKYNNIEKANVSVQYIKAKIVPESGRVKLGEPVDITYTIKAPWDKKPKKLTVAPGKGSQEVNTPEFNKIKTGWGYCIWTVKCAVQPFINGEVPEGSAKLIISPDISGKMSELKLKIPKIFSEEIKVSKDQLNLAQTVSPQEVKKVKDYTVYYIIAGIIIVLILVFVYFFFIRKRKEKPIVLTSWAEALLELTKLKDRVKDKILNPEKSMSFLTDIVRHYLEARFEIHAPKQTTQEFLKDMEGWKSPLSNKDRNFLRDFMVQADMIKFAKLDASEKQIIEAIDKAEGLVKETTPDAIEEINKDNGNIETK